MYYNFYELIPEIYLIITILILFTYGVIFEKLTANTIQHITLLSIISFLFTIYLYWINIFEFFPIENFVHNFFDINLAGTFLKIIVLLSTIFVLLLVLNKNYIKNYETIILITLASLGLIFIISANDFLILYLSLELYSLSIYILTGIWRTNKFSTEASLKYLLLGALSSGLYLLGAGLIYTYTADSLFTTIYCFSEEIKLGAVLIMIAIFFKLAMAPFHMWIPDIYEGSPTFITSYFAIVPKIILMGLIVKLLTGPFSSIFENFTIILYFVAISSLIVGSIGGINQTKIKRLIAYSSISHIGFISIALLPNTLFAIQSINIYLIYYIIMSINLFAIVLSLFGNTNCYITQLAGLSRKNPILAITLSINLLSMAGIPPLAGFWSKYLVLMSAIWENYYLLAIFAVLTSTISAFYYLRIIKFMYFKDTNDFWIKSVGDICYPININFITSIILGLTTYLIITLLFYPKPIMFLTSLTILFN